MHVDTTILDENELLFRIIYERTEITYLLMCHLVGEELLHLALDISRCILQHMQECLMLTVDIGKEMFSNQKHDPVRLAQVEMDEQGIDALVAALREHHVDRLKNKKCTPKNAMLYLDLLTNLERVGDHAENIATAVVPARVGGKLA